MTLFASLVVFPFNHRQEARDCHVFVKTSASTPLTRSHEGTAVYS